MRDDVPKHSVRPFQLANLNRHDPHMVVNNATALAKAAKAYGVPTILTSVIVERGGIIFPQITDVFLVLSAQSKNCVR